MSAVKITPADTSFSKCVRAVVGWRCERCGSYFPEDRRMGLHCSHYHRRSQWAVRFHPLNAASICNGCHRYFGNNPSEHTAWFIRRNGEGAMELLQEAVNDIERAKAYKRTKGKGEIAKHYREQYKAIEAGQNYIVEYL